MQKFVTVSTPQTERRIPPSAVAASADRLSGPEPRAEHRRSIIRTDVPMIQAS
jgi:hypothetical protein